MPEFKVEAPFVPLGDQPEAIAKLTEGIRRGDRAQVLLGATGTGKSLAASVIHANGARAAQPLAAPAQGGPLWPRRATRAP